MRLLVTGSRSWSDKERMWFCLDRIVAAYAAHYKDRFIREGLMLVSGHAKGADTLAEWWFHDRFPLEKPEIFKANWRKFGGRAGIFRNQEMVETRPDSCVAFIMQCTEEKCQRPEPHGTHGATHCADYAEEQGIPTTRFYGGEFQ